MDLFVVSLAAIAAGVAGYAFGKRRADGEKERDAPITSSTEAGPKESPDEVLLAPEPAIPEPVVAEPATIEPPKVAEPPALPVAQPAPATASAAHANVLQLQEPIAVKSVSKLPVRDGENQKQCHYRQLAQTSTQLLLKLLRDEGFELASFGATELHDRYEDFDSYDCDSYDELLRTQPWERVYGTWSMSGTYQGAAVLFKACDPSGLDEGIIVRYAEADERLVQPLVEAFERVFAPDVLTKEGDTIVDYAGTRASIELPAAGLDACHAIGKGVFKGNKSLVRLVIPACVETVGREAFMGCTSLKNLELQQGVRSLGERAFFECRALTHVQIPDSLTQIGSQAFWGCDSLKTAGPAETSGHGPTYDVAFGYEREIPDELFAYMKGLRCVVIPEGITRLGRMAFYCCDELEELVLPSTIEVIADDAIRNCPNLRSILLPEGARVKGGLLENCDALADEDGFIIVDSVLYGYVGHDVHVKIPEGVTRIADKAFEYQPRPGVNSGDIVSVSIPEGVVSIGPGAFKGCTHLEWVDLPKTAISIDPQAFAGCTKLEKARRETKPTPTPEGRSWPATMVVGSHMRHEGTLVIGSGDFSFLPKDVRNGGLQVSGALGERGENLVRSGSRLTAKTRGKQYCFELSSRDLDEIDSLRQKRQEAAQHLRSFTGSLADSCINGSWPEVTHPFFDAHMTASADKAAVFEFIGWGFLPRPLPLDDDRISIASSPQRLDISDKSGGGEYHYYETPTVMGVSYESHSVGFFDDSEHYEFSGCELEYIKQPDEAILQQAKQVREVKDGKGVCYLRNPFGMTGIFRLVRR